MLRMLFATIVFAAFLSLPLQASTYPRPLQILLEDVEDIGERARLIRIYQRPITPEDKKLVREARAKAASETKSKTRKSTKEKGKKGNKGKKKRRR